ncbi:MAG TPA: hypothetical protein VFU32_10995 [Ktedonobacterales bacterium]|nr:hypothetical protein [Ktedonobacterales bacterium]
MSSTFEQHCGQCGLLLPPGSTQCPRCGAPVAAEPTNAGGAPSEFFPSFPSSDDSDVTLVRPRSSEVSGAQSSQVAALAAEPASAEASASSGNTGPTGPLRTVLPDTEAPAPQSFPSGAMLSGPSPEMPQPSGGWSVAQPPAGPTWPGAPTGAPIYPGQPTYTGQPGMSSGFIPGGPPSGYGMPPGVYAPGYGAAPVQPPRGKLPVWFTGGVAALVVVGLLLIWLTGSDWGNGSLRLGIAALVVAVMVLVGFTIRVRQGYRASSTMNLGIASILILIIIGAAGIALVNPLHKAEGNSLDSSQQYLSAINEFKAANDTADVAHTYNDWGEHLMSLKNYQGALDKFTIVLNSYKNVPDEVDRAHADAATATYAIGQEQETDGDCQTAATTYQSLVKNFKDTPEASKAQAELKKPQTVTGLAVSLTTQQPAPNVQLFLSADWQISSGSFTASDDYSTITGSDGKFSFANIPPSDKKYLISYIDSSGNQITRGSASGDSPYAVLVPPLCAPSAVNIFV